MKVCPSAALKNPSQHSICWLSRQAYGATWANKYGALSLFEPTEQLKPEQALARRCLAGELACYMWATDVPHRGSGVLQHSARAVVPPPRLRAKWVVFSAALRTAQRGPGRGSAWRCGWGKSLRNPARVVVLGDAAGSGWVRFQERHRKKVIKKCGAEQVSEGPVFIGFRRLLREVIFSNVLSNYFVTH